MATKAHMSVRNIVIPKGISLSQALKQISKKLEVCPKCQGKEYIMDESKVEIFGSVSTIKVEGNELLEKLREEGNLTSSKVNKILETEYYGRKQCDKCNGLGLIKKSRKKDGNEEIKFDPF
jgi:hypothetical protein